MGGISAYGTLLKRGDGGSPETFTTLTDTSSITLNGLQTDEVEVTTHSSAAAGAFREFQVTLIDPGTLEFDLNYNPGDAGHVNLRNDWLTRAERNWQIVLPGAIQTISATGYVKGGPFDFAVDDVIKQRVTIRLTGAVSFS